MDGKGRQWRSDEKTQNKDFPQSIFCLDSVLLKMCLRNCEDEEKDSACNRAPSGKGWLKGKKQES